MAGKKLILIDGHSQLFKAFYGIRNLSSPGGLPTNAIFGFAQIINQIIAEFSPSHLCVCFDLAGKTFRNDLYPEYKAHRAPTPEDLDIQTPFAKKFVTLRGIRALEARGYEADDLLVTLARQASDAGMEACIVSSDKDLLQAVGDRITVVRKSSKAFEIMDRQAVIDKYGLPPERMTELQGLMGDSSDNIPGAPGIGEKTARKLLETVASLEELLTHTDRVANARFRRILEENADQIRLSCRLATLRDDVPLEIGVEDLAFEDRVTAELHAFYAEMGFAQLRDGAARALGLGRTPSLLDGLDMDGDAAPAGEPMRSVDAEGVEVALSAPQFQADILWTEEEVQAAAKAIKKAGCFAFDTETTSTDPMSARLVGISLAWDEERAVYIPVGHCAEAAPRAQPALERVCALLAPIFADPKIVRIAQNAKYDMHILGRHGAPVGDIAFDTMIASYLLNPDARQGLKSLSRQWLQVQMTPIEALIGSGRNQKTMDLVDVETAGLYAAADAHITYRLYGPMRQALVDAGLQKMMDDVEAPLIPVLLGMESNGVRIDPEHFHRLDTYVEGQLQELTARAHDLAGRAFNLDSPSQLGQVLFEELGLPGKKRGKSGLSTDEGVLAQLSDQHELPKVMLDYRMHKKIKSTYINGLLKLVRPETNRIHTSFNQTKAATGRLSSSDPNLQNIPVRTRLGLQVREGFLPADSGNVFVAADYSQIELRILAHVTEEAALVEAFRRDEDIHRLTASKLFGVALDGVTREQRAQAKTVNFGIIYGMSASRLSGELGISMGQAAAFIREYFAAYPGVKAWSKAVVAEARERGYVTTLLGRRRYLPDLQSKSPTIRANAERIAVNTPIQGAAADMIKVAMLRLDRRLRQENPQAVLILQVHDELILDVPKAQAEAVSELVRREMGEALPLSVPLKVDVKIGANWAEC